MTKSRISVILSHIFYNVGLICVFASLFFDFNSFWRNILLLVFIAAALCFIPCSKCPNCRRHGLKPSPFAKDAGYCSYCGELIQYDD